jgi:hypothetical protein
MELNPNHPVTKSAHDQWHKIAALILHKLGHHSIKITTKDVENLINSRLNVCIDERRKVVGNEDAFVIRLISDAEAIELIENETVILKEPPKDPSKN